MVEILMAKGSELHTSNAYMRFRSSSPSQVQYSNAQQTDRQTDRQTDVPGEVVVWSVKLGLLGLPQGATTVAKLGSPSEQGLNAGWRVWLCEPGSIEKDEGKESMLSNSYLNIHSLQPFFPSHTHQIHLPSQHPSKLSPKEGMLFHSVLPHPLG